MKSLFKLLFRLGFGSLIGLLIGCGPAKEPETAVLKVGIIATLSGPGSSWGRATVESARVVAEYHNEQGGYVIAGRPHLIKLIVADDGNLPEQAVNAAYRLVTQERVKLVIGPLSDDAVVAVAPILDAASVLYVHYGFAPDLMRKESSGILGMPTPVQTLPTIFRYLKEADVKSICVIARNGPEPIRQKSIAETLARNHGLEVKRFSKFDIAEETFGLKQAPEHTEAKMKRVIAQSPDAVVFTGLVPEELSVALLALRSTGYSGRVVTQNSQDLSFLREIGSAADGLIFVGGTFPKEKRSDYYRELRRRYLEISGEWSAEADTKLYALEWLLRCVGEVDLWDFSNVTEFMSELESREFEDPFFEDARAMNLVGRETFGVRRQIAVPVLISEFSGSSARVVFQGELPE